MYQTLPISPETADNLPNTTLQNAPSAYNSAVLADGFMPRTIYRKFPVMPENPDYFQRLLAKTGYYRPNSKLQNGITETKEASQAFGQIGFDKKLGAITDTIGTIAGAYNAYQQIKLAKKQMAHNQMEAERNYQAQRKMTNSQLEDRQKRRVEEAQANGRSTTSVADYMAKYAI